MNTDRFSSVPIQPPRPIKRRRLRSPGLLASGSDLPPLSDDNLNSLEFMKELRQDISQQTKLLAAILDVLQKQDSNCDV